MKKSDELRQQLDSKLKQLGAIADKAEGREDSELTEDEKKQFTNLETECEELREKIKWQEKREKAQLEAVSNKAPKEKQTPEEKADKRFSLRRAIASQLQGNKLEGIEKEMHEEAKREARGNGMSIEGVGIPAFISNRMQTRDNTVGTPKEGGRTVSEDMQGLIEALYPNLTVEQLGAMTMSGLQGDVPIPRNSKRGDASWKTETATADTETPEFEQPTLSPNRLPTVREFSKQLLHQSSIDVEAFMARDINKAIQIAVDAAAIEGGGANEPDGILSTTGIGEVYAGGAANNTVNTDGAAPIFKDVVNLEKEVAIDDADMGALAYLTTPGIRAFYKTTEKASNTAQFVWSDEPNTLNGYRAGVSTQVPSDLTKGSLNNGNAVLFGNWNELIIGNWGGMDIVVDPYSEAADGKVRIIANTFWDFVVRHPESFAAMVDADIS